MFKTNKEGTIVPKAHDESPYHSPSSHDISIDLIKGRAVLPEFHDYSSIKHRIHKLHITIGDLNNNFSIHYRLQRLDWKIWNKPELSHSKDMGLDKTRVGN